MSHLDKHVKAKPDIKCAIVDVLFESVIIAAGASVGMFNTLQDRLQFVQWTCLFCFEFGVHRPPYFYQRQKHADSAQPSGQLVCTVWVVMLVQSVCTSSRIHS